MQPKVLCVDDDISLLKAFERNLFHDYDLRIAGSGSAALGVLASEKDFSVVITDMRMPEMNGLEFIEQARQIASDSIYIMLTGNQDASTSIDAINRGNVFRFLTKPCSGAEIRSAIESAARQYDLLHGEKQLLEQTFVGAVNVLTDVVEALRPDAVQQSQRVDEIMKACEAALGGSGSWEYRLAGRLGLVGFALLPQADQTRFLRLSPGDPNSDMLLDRVAATSARLLGRIPRLNRVGEIIRQLSKANGAAFGVTPRDFTSTALAAILLRIAIHWTTMTYNGMSPGVALRMLGRAIPKIPREIENVLIGFDAPATHRKATRVSVVELTEGMVLAEDACGEDGATLLRKGRELTRTMIEKLTMHSRNGLGPTLFLVESLKR